MLTSIVFNIARAMVVALVIACAIFTMYAATNAISVYSNYDVFLAGIAAILLAALVNPLFCFIGAYGMVFYMDLPMWKVLVFVLPVLVAWSVAFVQMTLGRRA